MDCQSRTREAIHTSVNASFSALNLLKPEDRRDKGTNDQTVIAITRWKHRKFNQRLMCSIFDDLGVAMNDEKTMETYYRFSNFGLSLHETVRSSVTVVLNITGYWQNCYNITLSPRIHRHKMLQLRFDFFVIVGIYALSA